MNNLSVSGSATGNPRNNAALGPGKSLMDWVRLCNSGKDMTGTGGALLNVTTEQLASHNKTTDAWLAIRGIVYNVTEYMSFHPGGTDELMRGVGIDATKLFNKIHPWVNYESLLKACIIGRLVVINAPSPSSIWSDCIEKPVNERVSNLNSKLSAAKISEVPLLSDQSSKIVFRMDWFHQASSLTLFFYSKSTPPVTITLPLEVSVFLCKKKQLIIRIDKELHIYELEDEVRWPCVIKMHQTVVEIKLTKQLPKLWSSLGKKVTDSDEAIPEYCRMKVVHVSVVTYNTKLIGVQYEKNIIHHIHVGHHVKLKLEIEGEEVIRSYTPVSFLTQTPAAFPEPTLFFLIKEYEDGKLSRKLCSLKANDSIEMSTPRGTFNCVVLKERSTLLMFAAGTGLTPMTALIIWTLNFTRLNVKLMYFNKTEKDIIWKEETERLSTLNSRFQVTHVLSQPTELWEGEKGFISEQSFKFFLNDPIKENYVCVCGPPAFNDLCFKYLIQFGCSEDDYFAFGE